MSKSVKQFTHHIDQETGHEWLETPLVGQSLISHALLNKDTAFSLAERHALQLTGLLPVAVENMRDQLNRTYAQFQRFPSDLQKFIFLNNVYHRNETLFYKFFSEYLSECLPVLYTPGVGAAVKVFSDEYRQPNGLYLSYAEKDRMDDMLDNWIYPDVDLVVVTDGEGVLGIGDQGIGGMHIAIAKMMVYCLCGVNPIRTLPIMLDVGTNNTTLLNNPQYVGWKHNRITGDDYDAFIAQFVASVQKKYPNAFIHWEDLGRDNARRTLETYKASHCMFNDDMQGTGAVTLAALLAAVSATKIPFEKQRVVIYGAGTAGIGIADQLCATLVRQGLSVEEARKHFWLIDKYGLLLEDSASLTDFQRPYARTKAEVADWAGHDLMQVVEHVKPTILVGCSTQRGAFTAEVIETMSQHVARPIIFPLSNPTDRCEAQPENILLWSQGKALIATGSPFGEVTYEGKTFTIAQCNNALVFPGIGLGVLAAKANQVTDNMLFAASQALSKLAPVRHHPEGSLLPALADIRAVSRLVAIDVAKAAIRDGVATTSVELTNISDAVDAILWKPEYKEIRPASC